MKYKEKLKSTEEYYQRVEKTCQTYKNAQELKAKGIHVVSSDEKTGIQALEREAETKPVMKGKPELIEHNYIRHGTLSLIGNFEVATGKVLAPYINETRTEEDFAKNIENLISLDPEAGWIFLTS